MTTPVHIALTWREKDALDEARRLAAAGESMGTRKIVSMQGLERAELVRRIERGGMIADWELTELGRTWRR